MPSSTYNFYSKAPTYKVNFWKKYGSFMENTNICEYLFFIYLVIVSVKN